MKTREPRFELIERYLDARATAADVARLEQELRHDPELRAIYLEYANLDSALEACCAHAPAPASNRRLAWVPSWPAVFSFWRLASAGAVVLLIAGFLSLRPAKPPLPAATPVALEILKSDGVPLHAAGDRLTLSTLRIDSGSLEFRLDSGARVQAIGPAELDFLSPLALRLRQGKVTADVGRDARGFVIETRKARVVDFGTRFGVAVAESGKTDVAVFDGRVQVFDPNDSGRTAPVIASLRKGEGVQFGPRSRPTRLTTVSLTRDGLAWSASGRQSIVTDLTDNVQEPDFRYFYGIIAGGMAEGAPAYTDRPRISWTADNGGIFPPDLVAADLVCPFHTDRHQRDLKLSLHLAQPATVYVLHDARKPPLPWLKKEFANTGWRLRSGPWAKAAMVRGLTANTRGEYYVEYTVWRKVVRRAGPVELGPPHALGEGGAKAMFGIAVKPLGLSRLASAGGATATTAPRQGP